MHSVVAPTESGLALAVRGGGPDVVLIHGSLGDYRQWNAIVERLESNYRVVAVSRRHHWPNPPPQPDISYTYDGHSADLQLFLHAIGHPAHVVGHSYGAGVALLAALHGREWIRSLTLIEPAFGSLLPAATPELAPELASRESMVATVKAFIQEGDDERAAEALIDWVQAGAGGFSRLPQTARDGLLGNAKTIGLKHRRTRAYSDRRRAACFARSNSPAEWRVDPYVVQTHRASCSCVRAGRPCCHDPGGRPHGYRGKSDAGGDVVNTVSRRELTHVGTSLT
jgi:pimeloyl-ACP methyl ester carboxylesterase